MRRSSLIYIGLSLSLLGAAGCTEKPERPIPAKPTAPSRPSAPAPPPTLEPEALRHPVPLWENGAITGEIDAATAAAKGYVVLDLGEAWTPYIFTDGVGTTGQPLQNSFRNTYLQLARGEFPDNYHGERAREDKYLELYGIMPTLKVLRTRLQHMTKLACVKTIDLTPLEEFTGVVAHESKNAAYRAARAYTKRRPAVAAMMKRQRVAKAELLNPRRLTKRDREVLKRYLEVAAEYRAVDAAQKLLKCEGFFTGRAAYVRGVLDASTRQALVEFERRHRVYSWGYLGKDTLAMLRVPPLEAERQSILRVVSERAIHAAGVLEDGSTDTLRDGVPRTFQGADGKQHPLPNLVGDLQQRAVEAFGLQTPESALAWLVSLGALAPSEHLFAAFRAPSLPEYYGSDMQLTLTYDRGDIWYDFPYDEKGRGIPQPVQRRPNVTVAVKYQGQLVPLARYGTTVGGWRSEQVDDTTMWKYKQSPVGPRVWTEIVAAPVWIPPDSTPPRSLLKRKKKHKFLEPPYEVNYFETGPGYFSAYGLVAAYHNRFTTLPDGTIEVGHDEGIRTHGSVNYMSITRHHSHGCHRLHNHIAVRLMSFVLAHRPHTRNGQEQLGFRKTLEYEELLYDMQIKQGGYVFALDTPIQIEVLEGRIRGKLKGPISFVIPKYDGLLGAYVTADGGAVQLQGHKLVEVPLPPPPDGGVGGVKTPEDIFSPDLPRSIGGPDYRQAVQSPALAPPTFFGKPEG